MIDDQSNKQYWIPNDKIKMGPKNKIQKPQSQNSNLISKIEKATRKNRAEKKNQNRRKKNHKQGSNIY